MSKFTTKLAVKAQSRFATRRAMGTLEYVLIAAIVVALAYTFKGRISTVLDNLLGNVDDNTNNTLTSTSK